MSQILPPSLQHGARYEPPRVRQYTVFLDNKVGRLQMLLRALEEGAGKLAALAIEESGESALVRVICTNADAARLALDEAGLSFTETNLLAVELPEDSKHPLQTLCMALLAAEINIHYAYPLLLRPERPAVALYVDDLVLAAQVLIKKGFTIIADSDLQDL